MNTMFQLALDLTKGKQNFEYGGKSFGKKEANEMLRLEFLEKIGVEKITNYNEYQKHKYDIFQILSETITPIINERLEDSMGAFAEIRTVEYGDTIEFEIENHELFEVSRTAVGTANLIRQRNHNGRMKVSMGNFSAKIYTELYAFLSGNVDWSGMISKVAKSYEREIANAVNEVLFGSFSTLSPEFKYQGSFDEAEMLELLSRIETLYGSAVIVGTKAALNKIRPEYLSDSDKNDLHKLGYIGNFGSYRCVALQNVFQKGTYDFAISNNDLLILPSTDEKPVKILLEGSAIITDHQNTQGDQSIEHTFIQRAGVGMALTDKYGMVKFV